MRRALRGALLLLLWTMVSSQLRIAGIALAAPRIIELELGVSTLGRPIRGVQIGDGPRALWLIGSTHGRPEGNTYNLVVALEAHFRAHPEEVPSSVSLYFVPTVNPDGLELGTRQNANTVDLNRNMDTSYDACPENDWQAEVNGAYGIRSLTGGPHPESEVESILVREMLLEASAAIFYHADGGVVFPAYCEHPPSIALGQAYAEASGYGYTRFWEHYMITGGMHDWAASLGIASITPELITGVDADVEQNLAAIHMLLERAEELLPLPAPVSYLQEVELPAPIWRYWRSHGAEAVFGPPISPPLEEPDAVTQFFENSKITVHTDAPQPLHRFTVVPDGRRLWTERLLDAPASPFHPR